MSEPARLPPNILVVYKCRICRRRPSRCRCNKPIEESAQKVGRSGPNPAEAAFAAAANAAGWSVGKRGWPDFWMVRNGRICVCEVKRSGNIALRDSQLAILKFFAASGIEAYRWDPETGFTRIDP